MYPAGTRCAYQCGVRDRFGASSEERRLGSNIHEPDTVALGRGRATIGGGPTNGCSGTPEDGADGTLAGVATVCAAGLELDGNRDRNDLSQPK